MKIYLVRHGQTVVKREPKDIWDSYGPQGPPINKEAEAKARELHNQFASLGIDGAREPAAVSEYLRVRQTAECAGFKILRTDRLLNEINTNNPMLSRQLVKIGQVPPEAKAAAQQLLANPPAEKVWFTHGLVIAALLLETGQNTSQNLEPGFAEIIQFDIS